MSFKSEKCIGKGSHKPLTSYVSKEEAQEAINYIAETKDNYKPMCSYKCQKCGFYHLSPESRHTECKKCECLDSNGKNKMLYFSEESAKRRANILEKETSTKLFIYHCPIHNGYHLTHKSPEPFEY